MVYSYCVGVSVLVVVGLYVILVAHRASRSRGRGRRGRRGRLYQYRSGVGWDLCGWGIV